MYTCFVVFYDCGYIIILENYDDSFIYIIHRCTLALVQSYDYPESSNLEFYG